MAVTTKMYSESTTARKDVTGEPSQVYDMPDAAAWLLMQIKAGNASSIFRIDNNCEWLHIIHPQVVNDLHNNPEWIVGNSSDVLGEYRLIKIKVSQLRYFPIMGESNLLPVNPEASEAVEIARLRGGPLADEENVRIASLPCWLVAYKGMNLPQGDIRSDESASDLECMGAGYKIWYLWALKHVNTDRNDTLQNIIDDVKRDGTYERYVKPVDSPREFDASPMGSTLQAYASDYPDAAAVIRSTFMAEAPRPDLVRGVPGAVDVRGTTVIVKDARDEEKEVVALQGQARVALLNIGGKIDVNRGTVSDLTYPIVSSVLDGIHSMPRSSRGGQFAQALTRAHKKAKRNDRSSIFSVHASIIVFPRITATHFLVGNFNTETLDSPHGEAASIDCLVFAPQTSRSKINAVLVQETNQANESHCDVPAERATTPKSGIARVGDVATCEDFKKMMVNIINSAPVMVEVATMKAAGAPHLLTSFAEAFLDIMGPDWDAWIEKTGGGLYVHALLLQFFDSIFSNLASFAADFHNGNIFETKRPASETDDGPLVSAVLVLQHARDHFRKLQAIKQPCTTKPAIAHAMSTPATANSTVVVPRAATGTNERRSNSRRDSEPRRNDSERRYDPPRRDSSESTDTRGRVRERDDDRRDSGGARQRVRHGNRVDDYIPGDFKKKGMFEALNIDQAHLLLPANTSVCVLILPLRVANVPEGTVLLAPMVNGITMPRNRLTRRRWMILEILF